MKPAMKRLTISVYLFAAAKKKGRLELNSSLVSIADHM